MPTLRPRARPSATPRGRFGRALAAGVAAVVIFVPTVAGAASDDDPAARRDRVRKDRAAVAAKLDVLRASDADVQRALSDLDANLGAQQAVVATAQQAAAVADLQLAESVDAERRKAAELEVIKAQMAGIAVESYMSPLKGSLVTMLKSESFQDASMRREFLDISANHGADVTRQLKAAKADLEDRRKAAEAAQRRAGARRAEVEQRLAGLSQAAGQQRQVATQVEGRIESGLAESAALSTIDAQLSDQIASRQAALAAQVKAASVAVAAARVVTRAPDPPSGGGGAPVAVPSGSVGLTTVGGITVASSIAGQLQALLSAAQADGISLGGSGYRDSSAQVALRQANGCPDVYTAPASSCRVPTARPGSSMHEQGLAIDFSSGGGLLTRSSPAFAWLSANASRFGFFNLPSEPWHWSTNGN